MITEIIDSHSYSYIGVPRQLVNINYKQLDSKVTPTLLVVFCLIDKWRTWNKYQSFYKTSVLNLLEDMGQPYEINSRKPLSKLSDEIIYSLEYMERQSMFTLVKGDYHDPWRQFVIKINEDIFLSKEYIKLNVKHFNYILRQKSNVKKGNLLQVLLYSLSTYAIQKVIDINTGEMKNTFIQVYAESNKQTANKIGISDKTIAVCLGILSGSFEDKKPLIVYKHSSFFNQNNCQYRSMPYIYTENRPGYQERINYELQYFKTFLK